MPKILVIEADNCRVAAELLKTLIEELPEHGQDMFIVVSPALDPDSLLELERRVHLNVGSIGRERLSPSIAELLLLDARRSISELSPEKVLVALDMPRFRLNDLVPIWDQEERVPRRSSSGKTRWIPTRNLSKFSPVRTIRPTQAR